MTQFPPLAHKPLTTAYFTTGEDALLTPRLLVAPGDVDFLLLFSSRLDNGSAVYNRLRSMLSAAARSVAGLRRSDHIADTLASFHWLKAPERVQFKLATIVYRSLTSQPIQWRMITTINVDLKRR